MLKSCGVWGLGVSQSPVGTNWVLKLIGTWLGLGQGVFETKGLGPGLNNYFFDIFTLCTFFLGILIINTQINTIPWPYQTHIYIFLV